MYLERFADPTNNQSTTFPGFLSTADENSPGNYGIMDMSMALEWVYNNVRFFNGDREKITVFGPGAGGAAAGLLAVLPKTRMFVRQFISSVSDGEFHTSNLSLNGHFLFFRKVFRRWYQTWSVSYFQFVLKWSFSFSVRFLEDGL